jgi:branched-chain amino acid transport system ATP-binding protein
MADAATPLLQVNGLVRRFGGLVATDNLQLDILTGELHALIGPNGAGKTTAIAQFAGELRQNAGTIHFDGEEISHLSTPARVRRGLARSFQITQVLPDDTAEDNVALAVQIRSGHSFRFWRDARGDAQLREPARRYLDEAGLAARANIRAGDLAHGEQRQLELAMALAAEPRLLLLDEPMAGMGPAESRQMIDVLLRLKRRITLLLVEHDMDAVFALADRISVLVYGRCIATGSPDDIRANPDVRTAYLGEEHG